MLDGMDLSSMLPSRTGPPRIAIGSLDLNIGQPYPDPLPPGRQLGPTVEGIPNQWDLTMKVVAF